MTGNVVILSGGLDSAVTLAQALTEVPIALALTFDYGQRHAREVEAARALAAYYGVPHKVLSLGDLLSSDALLSTSPKAVPLGDYSDENRASTEVHGRNLLFASLAIAQAGRGGTIWTGVHGGDSGTYPDCRPEFWQGLDFLAAQAYGVKVCTPFLDMSKHFVVKRGDELGVPFDLTWSCYVGGGHHCGECGTCRERREAFTRAKVIDPTIYARNDFW